MEFIIPRLLKIQSPGAFPLSWILFILAIEKGIGLGKDSSPRLLRAQVFLWFLGWVTKDEWSGDRKLAFDVLSGPTWLQSVGQLLFLCSEAKQSNQSWLKIQEGRMMTAEDTGHQSGDGSMQSHFHYSEEQLRGCVLASEKEARRKTTTHFSFIALLRFNQIWGWGRGKGRRIK